MAGNIYGGVDQGSEGGEIMRGLKIVGFIFLSLVMTISLYTALFLMHARPGLGVPSVMAKIMLMILYVFVHFGFISSLRRR